MLPLSHAAIENRETSISDGYKPLVVTEEVTGLGRLRPWEFCARTRNMYDVSGCRPRTVNEVAFTESEATTQPCPANHKPPQHFRLLKTNTEI